MRPLVGILGGMGPLATVDLMRKIVDDMPAARDQDHVPVVAWNVPQVPDRQQALADAARGTPIDTASPLPAMLDGIARLNAAGATRIAIACNTAHYWFDQLAAASGAPLIHIADATLAALRAAQADAGPRLGPVGIIATRGTLQARLYQSRFAADGIDCIENTEDELDRLFVPGCYAVKRNRLAEGGALLESAGRALTQRGARSLVLACTELPPALEHIGSDLLPICIDPTRALARACIAYWIGTGGADAVEAMASCPPSLSL
jgi:aspartate racemase